MEILLSHNVLRVSLIMLSVLENGESCISEWLLDASGWVCRLWRLRDCSSAVVWMSAALDSVSHSRGEQRSLVWQALPQAVNLCSLCSGEKTNLFRAAQKTNTVHRCPSNPLWDLLCSVQHCFSCFLWLLKLKYFCMAQDADCMHFILHICL